MNLLVKNLIHRFASHGATRILISLNRIFVLIVAVKYVNESELAGFMISLSIAETIRVLSDFGSDAFIYRNIGKKYSNVLSDVKLLMYIRPIFALVLSIVALGLVSIVFKMKVSLVLIGALPIIWMFNANNIIIFQKLKFYRQQFVSSLSTVLVVPFVVYSGLAGVQNVLYYDVIYMAIDGFVAVYSIVFQRRIIFHLYTGSKLNHKSIKSLIHTMKSFYGIGITSLASLASSRIDLTVVRPILGIADQAIYSSAMRIVDPFFQIVTLLTYPMLSEFEKVSKINEVKSTHGNYLLLAIACLMALSGITFYSLTFLIFDNSDLSLVAALISTAFPFKLLNTYSSTMLAGYGLYNKVSMITCFVLLLVLVSTACSSYYLGLFFVPFALVLSDAVNCIMQLVLLGMYQNRKKWV